MNTLSVQQIQFKASHINNERIYTQIQTHTRNTMPSISLFTRDEDMYLYLRQHTCWASVCVCVWQMCTYAVCLPICLQVSFIFYVYVAEWRIVCVCVCEGRLLLFTTSIDVGFHHPSRPCVCVWERVNSCK